MICSRRMKKGQPNKIPNYHNNETKSVVNDKVIQNELYAESLWINQLHRGWNSPAIKVFNLIVKITQIPRGMDTTKYLL